MLLYVFTEHTDGVDPVGNRRLWW